MQIDNYDEAICRRQQRFAMALTEKLKESLPITARAGKPFLKTLKQRGENADPKREFLIDFVGYSGDEGSIMCALADDANDPDNKERYVVSINVSC